MKKLCELINRKRELEQVIEGLKDESENALSSFKEKERELVEKRDKKLGEAIDFKHRMDIANGWSSANHRLLFEYLRVEKKREEQMVPLAGELESLNNEIRVRGKKLSKKVHISHGMMAEALTKYFENNGWTGEWKMMRVHPYLFNEKSARAEHRFGTYIVSSESENYLNDEIYTLNDSNNEFPLAICVGFGKGDAQAVQIAQDKLDKINWFDIYLQDLVGGVDIPKHLAVFKNSESEYWDFVQDAFRTIVLESSEFELNEEDEQE